MPKAYFEPDNLNALVEVFTEAKRRLNSQDVNDPAKLDLVAYRILCLAADGLSPCAILNEITPQLDAKSTLTSHGGENAAQQEAAQ